MNQPLHIDLLLALGLDESLLVVSDEIAEIGAGLAKTPQIVDIQVVEHVLQVVARH